MTKQRKILNLIEKIRDSHESMTHIFTQGSCMNFFAILHAIYPEAKAWYNVDHVITEIDGKFYDITGQVSPNGYLPFTDYHNKRRTSRAFTQMYNK